MCEAELVLSKSEPGIYPDIPYHHYIIDVLGRCYCM